MTIIFTRKSTFLVCVAHIVYAYTFAAVMIINEVNGKERIFKSENTSSNVLRIILIINTFHKCRKSFE